MVSCGYETTAVIDGFGSMKGFLAMVRGTFSSYRDDGALKLLNESTPSGSATLVKIAAVADKPVMEETNV
jgi:hypothetical protein